MENQRARLLMGEREAYFLWVSLSPKWTKHAEMFKHVGSSGQHKSRVDPKTWIELPKFYSKGKGDKS